MAALLSKCFQLHPSMHCIFEKWNGIQNFPITVGGQRTRTIFISIVQRSFVLVKLHEELYFFFFPLSRDRVTCVSLGLTDTWVSLHAIFADGLWFLNLSWAVFVSHARTNREDAYIYCTPYPQVSRVALDVHPQKCYIVFLVFLKSRLFNFRVYYLGFFFLNLALTIFDCRCWFRRVEARTYLLVHIR
jgi:hypothetical protein